MDYMQALTPTRPLAPPPCLSPPSSPAAASPCRSSRSSSLTGCATPCSPMSSPIPSTGIVSLVDAEVANEETSSGLSDEQCLHFANFELKIATQPPAKTVYQRILKPFPCVVLVPKATRSDLGSVDTVADGHGTTQLHPSARLQSSAVDDEEEGPGLLAALARAATTKQSGGVKSNDNSTRLTTTASAASFIDNVQHAGLFVEASLVRSDTGTPVAKCLDGNTMARFERSSWNGGVMTATFKKLKILSTSQQLQGALLRLQFTLKKYTGTNFATINTPGCSVLSQPIEVFSHSQYLHKKEKGTKQSRSNSVDTEQQGREKVRKLDQHDSRNMNLIAAITAFKKQGGTKEMLMQCIDSCFDEPSAHMREIPMDIQRPAFQHESPARPQPCSLPPLRQQLSSVIQMVTATTTTTKSSQPTTYTVRANGEATPHSTNAMIRRGSLPDSRMLDGRQDSVPSPKESSKILPPLSSLSLLPQSAVSHHHHHGTIHPQAQHPVIGNSPATGANMPQAFHASSAYHHAAIPSHQAYPLYTDSMGGIKRNRGYYY